MIEEIGVAARGLHTATALLVFGTLVCLHLPPRTARSALGPWHTRWLNVALLLSLCALMLGVAVLASQAASVDSAAAWHETAERLLRASRFGSVWIARQALMLITCVLLSFSLASLSRNLAAQLALLASGAAIALAPLSGHSAAVEPAWPALSMHAVHVVATGAWWGALPALATLIVLCARGRVERTLGVAVLARFSSAALPLMATIIVTGGLLAVTQVERWPALLGTRYGAWLLLKILLLTFVLAMAAKLRWRLLPALHADTSSQILKRCAYWIAAESLVAAGIVLLAAQLAQTVPAGHDAVAWWLPFRFSIDATWELPGTAVKVWSGFVLLLAALALVALSLRYRVRRVRGLAAAALLCAGSAALALSALSVEAYPDTYRKPSVPYQAISVAAGAELYTIHCAGCHGTSGHGDGPQARALARPPADLTEPHTALHTAGDLFWWLTHGKPPGVMPGFGERLSEDDKWDLINYLRTLSAGYQARILTERVVPHRPWLGALDFNYATRQGSSGSLKDFRERSAVLIVFYTLPASTERLAQLADAYSPLRAANVEMLAIPTKQNPAAADDGLPIVVEDAAEIVRAYALLRRTLGNLDARDRFPVPAHMEILVDRFGYIRARWVPAEGTGWAQMDTLLAQARVLEREPRIAQPPDDHVH